MKKLELKDIYPPPIYEAMREEFRRTVREIKRPRRVELGPVVSFTFENRATMTLQVSEMLRAEKIVDLAAMQQELDVYNSLLPDEGELSATLFVEITEQEAIKPTLRRMVGIDAHVVMEAGGERVPAVFEAGRSEEERIAAVQYVRFRPGENAKRAILTPGASVALSSDLPGYSHRTVLSEATRASLAADLGGAN